MKKISLLLAIGAASVWGACGAGGLSFESASFTAGGQTVTMACNTGENAVQYVRACGNIHPEETWENRVAACMDSANHARELISDRLKFDEAAKKPVKTAKHGTDCALNGETWSCKSWQDASDVQIKDFSGANDPNGRMFDMSDNVPVEIE